MGKPVLFLIAACVAAVWSHPVQAQRWQFDAGFVRGDVQWAETATLRTRAGSLVVRCVDNRLDLYVETRSDPGAAQSLPVRLTAPDREPVLQSWPVMAGSRVAFTNSPGSLARQLQAGVPVKLEVQDAGGRYVEIPVSSDRAGEAIGAVMQTCDVPMGDIDVVMPGVDTRVIDAIETISRWDAWRLRYLLMAGEERLTPTARPLVLYRRLNYFYAVTLPQACLNRDSPVWRLALCDDYRVRRERDGMGSFDIGPIEALIAFARAGGRTEALAGRSPDCNGPDTEPLREGGIDVARIFIDRLDRSASEGSIVASVFVSAEGAVTGVQILSARPRGRYQDPLERELRGVSFAPATENCRPVAGAYLLRLSMRFVQ